MDPGALRGWATLAVTILLIFRAEREGFFRLGMRHRARLIRLVALAALAWPWEKRFGPTADPFLQHITADASAWFLRMTGFAARVVSVYGGAPHIVGPGVDVRVTSLCAGLETFIGLLGLGLVLVEVLLTDCAGAWIYVVLTPLFGFVGNVLRIALSTHAARFWGNDPAAWNTAHDVIGYGSFVLTYGLLFLLIRRRSRAM